MKSKLFAYLVVIITIIPTLLFSQNNNRLSIQTGLFHYYMDYSPLMNINKEHGKRGVLYSSYGIAYRRQINAKNALSIGISSYINSFDVAKELGAYNRYRREFFTFNISYERILNITKRFDFTFGGGINYRIGSESVSHFYPYDFCVLGNTINVNDAGFNLNAGITYTPIKWLSFYSKINLISFVYSESQQTIKEWRNADFEHYFSSPFDLSLQFGIGFNFGK